MPPFDFGWTWSRFAAYLLEPREGISEENQIAEALLLLCDLKKAAGSTTTANQLLGWAVKCKAGKFSSAGSVKALRVLLGTLKTSAFSGDPAFCVVKRMIRSERIPFPYGGERLIGNFCCLCHT